jgi:CHAT domain-containing protein
VERWRKARAAFETAWADLLQAGEDADQTTRTAYLTARNLWFDVLEGTTRWLWDHAVGPAITRLRALGYTRAEWVPTGLLALLPLHAAWRTEKGKRRYAVEDLAFAYTPSARALEHARRTADVTEADSLFAIDNPLGDIRHSAAEIKAVRRHFASAKEPVPWIARGPQANTNTIKDALHQRSVLHLSCHGVNNPSEPLASALKLAFGQTFTAGDLLRMETQVQARLVFLSACATGLIGTELPDEVIGWPAAFLQAGSASVLSSLWGTNARSTASLVRLFYERWLACGEEPIDALAHAQRCMAGSEHLFHWAGFSLTGV